MGHTCTASEADGAHVHSERGPWGTRAQRARLMGYTCTASAADGASQRAWPTAQHGRVPVVRETRAAHTPATTPSAAPWCGTAKRSVKRTARLKAGKTLSACTPNDSVEAQGMRHPARRDTMPCDPRDRRAAAVSTHPPLPPPQQSPPAPGRGGLRCPLTLGPPGAATRRASTRPGTASSCAACRSACGGGGVVMVCGVWERRPQLARCRVVGGACKHTHSRRVLQRVGRTIWERSAGGCHPWRG
jgi:hypothetical protein